MENYEYAQNRLKNHLRAICIGGGTGTHILGKRQQQQQHYINAYDRGCALFVTPLSAGFAKLYVETHCSLLHDDRHRSDERCSTGETLLCCADACISHWEAAVSTRRERTAATLNDIYPIQY